MWTVEEWTDNDGDPSVMLVCRPSMDFVELAFIESAMRLRATRIDAFEDMWSVLNHLNDAGTEGLEA